MVIWYNKGGLLKRSDLMSNEKFKIKPAILVLLFIAVAFLNKPLISLAIVIICAILFF